MLFLGYLQAIHPKINFVFTKNTFILILESNLMIKIWLRCLSATLLTFMLAITVIAAPAQAFNPDDVDQLVNEYFCPECDLSGADLHGAFLPGSLLVGADLSGADLHEANLSGADLDNVNLTGANLDYADLAGAILFEANLTGASLEETFLLQADLDNANFENATMPYTIMPDGSSFYPGDPVDIYGAIGQPLF